MRATDAARSSTTTLEPLELKGKAEPVPAWEAVGLIAAQPVRRAAPASEAPLVGRDDELDAARRPLRARRARGPPAPGDGGRRGRRRQVARCCASSSASSARAIRGAHVPRGPLPALRLGHRLLGARRGAARRVRDRRRDSAEEAWGKLRAYVARAARRHGDEQPSRRARGRADRRACSASRCPGELAPDERRPRAHARGVLLRGARAASRRWRRGGPLVLVFEDIHWADHGMLDLIEHLAQWVRAPLMLLCLARDELLERRPSWGGGRRVATSALLDPLSAEQTPRAGRARCCRDGPRGACPRVAERAGGNPFFAEEMVRRLAEEGSDEAAELPDTVQALLAARLDSLEPFERRAGAAGGGGRAHVLGGRAGAARRRPRARELEQALDCAAGEGHPRPRRRQPRSRGERELAFKHVLIRDVAYGMLPKAVRARKHFEVGGFIEERAGDRTDEVVALLAEHYGRAAALGGEAGWRRGELEPIRAQGAALPRGGRRRRGARSTPTPRRSRTTGRARRSARDDAGDARRADRREAGRRRAAPGPRRRGDRACGRSASSTTARQEDLERVADLHRKIGAALVAQGRAQAGDRALPEGHQPAQGRPARARARAPLRGGGLALHAHGRQHARDLRVREGAAAGRAAGGDARREPRARDLRPRVRPHRRHREGAREPRARRSSWRAAPTHGETILALLGARPPPRGLRGRLRRARGRPTGRRSRSPSRSATLPAQVELHVVARAARRPTAPTGSGVERSTEASADAGRARGPGRASSASRTRCAACCAGARATGTRPSVLFRRAHELAEQVGWSEVAFPALFGLGDRAARPRRPRRRAPPRSTRRSTSASAPGLIAQSIQAIGARAVILALAHRRAGGARGRRGGGRSWPSACTTRSAARRRSRRAGVADEDPRGRRRRCSRRPSDAWRALDRPLEATRARLLAGQVLRGPRRRPRPRAARAGRRRRARSSGVPHLAEQARALAAGSEQLHQG